MLKSELTVASEAALQEDTPPPYPVPRYSVAMALRQWQIALASLLSSYRSDWFFHLFAGLILPIALIFFARGITSSLSHEQAIFFLGGNLAISLAFGPTTFLIGKLGYAKQNREFEYWIALPMPKMVLVLAIIAVALLFALPGIIGTYLLGSLMLGLPLTGGWALILLVPLSTLSLAGMGALIGSSAPNAQTANLIANLMITIVGFLSPMMIPLERLPLPLHFTAWLLPTTYIADAFRQVLAGSFNSTLLLDVLVLIASSVILLLIAAWRIDWRAK